MIICGLDLAFASSGLAFLDYESGDLVHYGTIVTTPKDTLNDRLDQIANQVEWEVQANKPFDVYVETPISYKSGTTTLRLGMVHGVVRRTLKTCGFPTIGEVNPTTLKKLATGSGRAGKPEMVAAALKHWGVKLQHDVADAAFVAEIGRREVQATMTALEQS